MPAAAPQPGASPGADAGGEPAPARLPVEAGPSLAVAPAASPASRSVDDRFALAWSSVLGAGYFPVASGTFGSLCALPLVFAFSTLPPPLWLLTVAAFTAVTIWTAQRAGELHGVVDSGRIVADEVVGQLLALAFVPLSFQTVLAGFLLFRAADIFKPWPASFFDRKVKNGFGVTLDDVVAGLYARAGVEVLLRLGVIS